MQPSKYITAGRLKTVDGDSSLPIAAGHRIIINLCNAEGVWLNSADSITKRWPQTKQEYVRWHRFQTKFKLGELQEVNMQSDTCVANILVCNKDSSIDEPALTSCIDKIGNLAVNYGSSVHINNFDNNWNIIETQLIEKVIKRGINVTIYNENTKKS
jgi:hypothetical protein